MQPIFIAATRSFWFGILPILAIALDVIVTLAADPASGPPVAATLAALLAALTPDAWGLDLDPARIEAGMKALAPLFALIIAHQRRGENRPYTLRATRDTLS